MDIPADAQSSWLSWARHLQAIAQNGLNYGHDPYDIDRFESVRTIAAAMMAHAAGVEAASVRELFTLDSGHATPKVDVRGAVFRDDAILLVRERSDGLWTLPGGWADPGETPSESVVREVYEESGYRTRAVKLLAVYDRDRQGHTPMPFYCYKMFFLCAIDDATESPIPAVQGAAPHGAAFAEIDGVDFFREDALPDLSISRVTPTQIHRFFAHQRHPDWPADFD